MAETDPLIMKIAIDGPAGSGKSTVGAALAKRLHYLYFDTGVMYRAVTLAALQRGIPLADEAAVSALAEAVHITVTAPDLTDGRQYTVRLDGADVTWEIRSVEVDANVSVPSAYPKVREAMVQQQRRIAAAGNVVMVGRDIGTVVLPDADLKIYLTASAAERARRRFEELQQRGQQANYPNILSAIEQRDHIDSSRKASPLRAADDAILLDCTDLSPEETAQTAMALITENAKSNRQN